MTQRSAHWMVHLPGEAYANDLQFKKPLNEQEVRTYLREWHSVERLFSGTKVWVK